MNRHFDRLNAWHLELGILADALDHLALDIEPEGLAATAHVLRHRLRQLLDACPFPEVADLIPEGAQS